MMKWVEIKICVRVKGRTSEEIKVFGLASFKLIRGLGVLTVEGFPGAAGS